MNMSSAPFLPFMNSMAQHMDPKMDTPSVWLWIVGDSLDMETVTNYIASDMQDYDSKLSCYIPGKAEQINNMTS